VFDELVDGKADVFKDMLLIISAAYGCIELCERIARVTMENNGAVDDEHAAFICRIFCPLRCTMSPKQRNDSSSLLQRTLLECIESPKNHCLLSKTELKNDIRISTATDEASSQDIVDEFGAVAPHAFFTSLSTIANLPTLCLFIAQTAAQNNAGQLFPLFSCSPELNIRQLPLYRVTSDGLSFSPNKSSKLQAPLLDCLVTAEDAIDLGSISMSIFPYQFGGQVGDRQSSAHAIAGGATVRNMFAELDDQLHQVSAACAGYITVEHVRSLISLLLGTKYPDAFVEMDDFNPFCRGADKTCVLLEVALKIIQENFDSLASVKGWQMLYSHLMRQIVTAGKANWKEQQLPSSFHELVSATITIFQALSSTRFAFLDGQCRATSSSFYLRNIAAHVSPPVVYRELQVSLQEHRGPRDNPCIRDIYPSQHFFDNILNNIPTTIRIPFCEEGHDGALEDHVICLCKILSDSILKSIQNAAPMNLHDVLKQVSQEMKSNLVNWDMSGDHVIDATRQKRYWIVEKILSFKCKSTDNMFTELLSSPNVGVPCPKPSSSRKTSRSTLPSITDDDDDCATLNVDGQLMFDLTKKEGIARSIFHKSKGRLRHDGIPTHQTAYPKPGELVAITLLLCNATPDVESIDIIRNCICNNWLGNYQSILDLGARIVSTDDDCGSLTAADFVAGTFKTSQGTLGDGSNIPFSSAPKVFVFLCFIVFVRFIFHHSWLTTHPAFAVATHSQRGEI
jgi:hypothetical protein